MMSLSSGLQSKKEVRVQWPGPDINIADEKGISLVFQQRSWCFKNKLHQGGPSSMKNSLTMTSKFRTYAYAECR